ncbi:hypothetical protein [Thalassotalea sediminis]|uniref:hypothetical protein n=1 Tax=Thalassotalea sediminis TaxID=1759089 RepID=UPI0025724837|nr:hypothetical protein [Thalassotalea sediminis]
MNRKHNYDAFGNSIVGHIQERENTRKLQEQISKAFSRSGEQGAVNLNLGEFENPVAEWNRLEQSGQLDSLPDDEYYALAKAANSVEYLAGTEGRVEAANNASLARNAARSQYVADYGNYLTDMANWSSYKLAYDTFQDRTESLNNRMELAAAQQRRFAYGNAQAAASFDALRPTGFDGNFTDAEWQAKINNKVNQWAQPVYDTFGYVTDAALLMTGVGAIAPFSDNNTKFR